MLLVRKAEVSFVLFRVGRVSEGVVNVCYRMRRVSVGMVNVSCHTDSAMFPKVWWTCAVICAMYL